MNGTGLFRCVDEDGSGVAALSSNGLPVADIFQAFANGEPLDELVTRLGLSSSEALAAVAYSALGSSDNASLGLVQKNPSRPELVKLLGEKAFAKLLPGVSHSARLALAAGMLQAFDFWEESHEAAQRAEDLRETLVSPYWHGIAHRREPDAGNASYWFRRVGTHEVFKPLAAAVKPLLDGQPKFLDKLLPSGTWNPFAFISLTTNPPVGVEALARRIQRLEMALLLEASLPSKS